MKPEEIAEIRACLPPVLRFDYTPDLSAPWLLRQRMPKAAPLAVLKSGPLARYLTRPLVKPVVAACGDGQLARADLSPVLAPFTTLASTAPGLAGQAVAGCAPWVGHEVTLAAWGTDRDSYGWGQISRPGGNLVLQLSFPAEHARLFRDHFPMDHRKAFEWYGHPIRKDGLPTLAWARLDVDMGLGVALIEEVQSDWFRLLARRRAALERQAPRSRELRTMQAYEMRARRRYASGWDETILLATLDFLTRELGVREIYLHQPDSGAVLKRISHRKPPVSLYTRLPRRFGFTPTEDAPAFLEKPARKKLRQLRRKQGPLFWSLHL